MNQTELTIRVSADCRSFVVVRADGSGPSGRVRPRPGSPSVSEGHVGDTLVYESKSRGGALVTVIERLTGK